MKRVALGVAAITALIGVRAFAADMVVKAPPPAPPPVYSWTGFYVGGDLGGAWTSNTGTWNPLPSEAAFSEYNQIGGNGGSSFLGGFHAGYNYQFAPTWVSGLEGDWSWTKAKGSFTQPWVEFPRVQLFPPTLIL